MSGGVSPLFKKLVDGGAFGELPDQPCSELPKSETTQGVRMVQADSGEWLPQSDCLLCPQGEGKLVWIKL